MPITTLGVTSVAEPSYLLSTRTMTSSSMGPLVTSVSNGGLAQCEGTNFSELDLDGLRGTVCRISVAELDISSCCVSDVKTANTCTQYCEVSSDFDGLTMSESTFAACARRANNGVEVANECGLYYGDLDGASSGSGTSSPYGSSNSSATLTGSISSPSVACRPDSFPNYDTTGMNGTVCAVSVPPSELSIASCCSDRVRTVNSCTQYCETARQGDLYNDRAQFSDCVEAKNGGESLNNMCQVVRSTNSSLNDTRPQTSEPYTGAASTQSSILNAAMMGGILSLGCLALLL